MSCAQKHGVFRNPHFGGFGFGAKSADITAFSGFFSFTNLRLKTDLGNKICFWGGIRGVFKRIWEVLKARKKVFGMRKKGYKGRTEKRILSKYNDVCRKLGKKSHMGISEITVQCLYDVKNLHEARMAIYAMNANRGFKIQDGISATNLRKLGALYLEFVKHVVSKTPLVKSDTDASVSADPLISALTAMGLTFRDNREKSGCLWVFGGME